MIRSSIRIFVSLVLDLASSYYYGCTTVVAAVGFGPVILDPQDPHFVGCLRRSANTAEITAQVQALLWFREYRRQHPQAPATLCILYDSRNAFQAISCDVPPAEHAAAAATGQGLRRWLETDGVTVNFIWI
jgi:hypothetical protein